MNIYSKKKNRKDQKLNKKKSQTFNQNQKVPFPQETHNKRSQLNSHINNSTIHKIIKKYGKYLGIYNSDLEYINILSENDEEVVCSMPWESTCPITNRPVVTANLGNMIKRDVNEFIPKNKNNLRTDFKFTFDKTYNDNNKCATKHILEIEGKHDEEQMIYQELFNFPIIKIKTSRDNTSLLNNTNFSDIERIDPYFSNILNFYLPIINNKFKSKDVKEFKVRNIINMQFINGLYKCIETNQEKVEDYMHTIQGCERPAAQNQHRVVIGKRPNREEVIPETLVISFKFPEDINAINMLNKGPINTISRVHLQGDPTQIIVKCSVVKIKGKYYLLNSEENFNGIEPNVKAEEIDVKIIGK